MGSPGDKTSVEHREFSSEKGFLVQRITLALNEKTWQSRETLKGRVYWQGNPDSVELLIAALCGTDAEAFRAVAGHWTGLLETGDSVLLAQDPLRSWPLFLATAPDGSVTITDDISVARKAAGNPARDSQSLLEFSHLSYVTGPRTLFERIDQVQAGELLTVTPDGDHDSAFYREVVTKATPGIDDDATLDTVFTDALDTAFDRLFGRVGNRQVVIPLSGGLDSRLLSVIMRDRGHNNVVNFTYGVGTTREVEISREVAEALGQRWEFIQYSNEEIKAAWASAEAGNFIRSSYAGASLPHIQDWYPVQQLQRRGLIDDDAVFLPGHTIVGNTHDDWIADLLGEVSPEQLARTIIAHHDASRPGVPALERNQTFKAQVLQTIERAGYDGTPESRLRVMEHWNLLERQTKYINNSMRNYEQFGYDWALPMLDREVLDVWDTFASSIIRDREWYRRYVDHRYVAATGTEIKTFEAFAAARISPSGRQRIKKILNAFGLQRRIEREITARAVAAHPMAFQTFVGDTSEAELRRFILRGGDPMAIYNEQFLADTWNPFAKVFTP